MNRTDKVCGIETSKRIMEHVLLETEYFCLNENELITDDDRIIYDLKIGIFDTYSVIPAPDVPELFQLLPPQIEKFQGGGHGYYASVFHKAELAYSAGYNTLIRSVNLKLVDTLAHLLLSLMDECMIDISTLKL